MTTRLDDTGLTFSDASLQAKAAFPGNYVYNALAADVALSNNTLFFDGPTVTLGTGTWFVFAKATFRDTAAVGASYTLKLWDGTTVIDSANQFTNASGVPNQASMAGVIVNPAGPVKLSIKDSTATTGILMANNSGIAKDSSITAVRIG